MGLTKDLGALPRVITVSSNDNVIIGPSANTGQKLQINGSSKVTGNLTVGLDTLEWMMSGVANGGAIWQKSHSFAAGANDRYLRFGNVNNNGAVNYVMSIHDNNVGIGITAPQSKVHVDSGMIWLTGLTGNNANINGVGIWGGNNGGGIYPRGTNGAGSFEIGNTQGNIFLSASGNVLIGTTTDSGAKLQVNGVGYISGRLSLGNGTVANFNAINIGSATYTNTAAITIGASNPTGGVVSPIITLNAPDANYNYAVRGGMYYNGSNLQMEFRTTSDYRVKEDLIEDFNAIDLLDKIKIYDHKWIGASGRSYSVIAHELQDVIPYLVSGQKDAILEDGSMDLQSVDYSKLVPILIKSIQELTERIKILENK